MLKVIREGSVDVNFTFAAAAVEGQVAMLDAAAEGKGKVSDGTSAYGFISQSNKNYAAGEVRPVVGALADYGEKIGLYVEGGEFVTDQVVAATYAPGETLYVTTAGKLVNVYAAAATAVAGAISVGIVIQAVGDGVHFRSLL